jgi:hypothetical protein
LVKMVQGRSLYIDFLTEDADLRGSGRQIDGITASLCPGIDRTLQTRRWVEVEGKDVYGSQRTLKVPIADIGPLLVLKLNAFEGETSEGCLRRFAPRDRMARGSGSGRSCFSSRRSGRKQRILPSKACCGGAFRFPRPTGSHTSHAIYVWRQSRLGELGKESYGRPRDHRASPAGTLSVRL